MKLLAIDPGNVQSAWVLFDYGMIADFAITLNADMPDHFDYLEHVAIEYMKPRGMPTAKEEMDTMFWAGRIVQAICGYDDIPWTPVHRMDVKLHLCGNARAKDKNVMQALKDRYGGNGCKGTKKNPGPLYGFHDDLWAALAVGLTFLDTRLHTGATQ